MVTHICFMSWECVKFHASKRRHPMHHVFATIPRQSRTSPCTSSNTVLMLLLSHAAELSSTISNPKFSSLILDRTEDLHAFLPGLMQYFKCCDDLILNLNLFYLFHSIFRYIHIGLKQILLKNISSLICLMFKYQDS